MEESKQDVSMVGFARILEDMEEVDDVKFDLAEDSSPSQFV